MTRKSCAVGMRNAILRNYLKEWLSLSTDPTKYSLSNAHVKEAGIIAEPHTLENLVTHRSEKVWLSRDFPSVRPSANTLKTKESSTVTIATSLILVSTLLLRAVAASYPLTSVT